MSGGDEHLGLAACLDKHGRAMAEVSLRALLFPALLSGRTIPGDDGRGRGTFVQGHDDCVVEDNRAGG